MDESDGEWEAKKDDNKTHGNLLNHILIFLLSIVIVATNTFYILFSLLGL